MSMIEYIKQVLYGLSSLGESYDFIEDSDLIFLNDYFKQFRLLFMLKETLDSPMKSEYDIDDDFLESLTNSVRKVTKKSRDAAKLSHILKKLHFKSLFNCLKELANYEHIPTEYNGPLHEIDIDFVRHKDFPDNRQHQVESDEFSQSEHSDYSDVSELTENVMHDNTKLPTYQDIRYNDNKGGLHGYSDFQIIGLQRDLQQPLGITIVKSALFYNGETINKCVIERILVNSLIDKQGLMQVGDIIFEVNDQPIETPEDLQSLLSKCKGTLTFKIMKSTKRPISNSTNLEKTYLRALFDYDPSKDRLLPSEQIGLPFKAGEVFEVLNRDDPNFWQAIPLDYKDHQAFLIPSQSLQERIIALQKDNQPKSNESNFGKGKRRKSKKNEIFRAKDAADMVSEADLKTYEDVVRFGPSRVPCVLLIGPVGVGKKAIKHHLVQREPNRFAFPLQDTSEAKKSRNQPLFNHVDKNVMINDIKASLYVCLEEKSGELYGIKSSGIRELINQGKTVILDCQPKDVYSLRNPLFNPFVILIAAPGMTTLEAMQKEGLQRNLTKNKRSTSELQSIIDLSKDFENMYKHLINAVIVNDNIQQTASSISSLIFDFENSFSWIPASWEYEITPLPTSKSTNHKTILKPHDSSSIQRRYEKKSTKPSVSMPSNKIAITNQNDNSQSEPESDSNSDENLVMAKPIKYSDQKKSDDNLAKVEEKQLKISISKKSLNAAPKIEEKPKKVLNTKKQDDVVVPKVELRLSNSKKVENIPTKKDDKSPVRNSNSQKMDDSKLKNQNSTRETPNNDNAKPANLYEKNTNASVAPKTKGGTLNTSTNNRNKGPELKQDESIKRNKPVIAQKPKVSIRNERRMKIVQKGNSSSEISDTSSEDELVMKENRV